MPSSTPKRTTEAAVTSARIHSRGLLRWRSYKPRKSTRRTAIVKTIAPSTQTGRNCSGHGEEKEHEHDHKGRREVRQLVTATGGFDHCSLRRAAIDYKRSAQSRRRVGSGNAEQIAILVERLMMFCGVGSSGDRALSHDHHEAGSGYWQQVANKPPIQRRDRKMRRSACDRTDHLNSVS